LGRKAQKGPAERGDSVRFAHDPEERRLEKKGKKKGYELTAGGSAEAKELVRKGNPNSGVLMRSNQRAGPEPRRRA